MSNMTVVYNLTKEPDAPSRATINRALRSAADASMVRQPEDYSLYEITDRGREWLRENSDDRDDLTKDSNDSTGILG